MKSIRSVRIVGVAIVATLVILSNGCGKDVPSPTAPTPTPSPTPIPTPTPTPTPTTFSFIPLGGDAMGRSASELPLWGLRGENTELLVKQMVFGDQSTSANPGFGPMKRLNGPATIVSKISSEFTPQLQAAALVLQTAIGFSVTVSSVSTVGSAQFQVIVDPTISPYAQIARYIVNGVVTGGLISLREASAETIDYSIRHELGHAFGLDHHEGLGLMGTYMNLDSFDVAKFDYSMSEKDNINMMLRLPGGTPSPSGNVSSLTASSASARTRTETVICSFAR